MSEPTRRRSPRAAPLPDAVLDYVLSSPWAITEAGLQRVLAVASRLTLSPEALQQVDGTPLDNTRAVTVRDGVATIPVRGVLVQRAGLFSSVSGATSYTQLALDVRTAVDDPQVTALLLDIDSPGGDVAGCHELWQQLMAVRGVKPIEAYIGGDGCSAAYWVACAADRLSASETAIVGCLGVRISGMDDARALKRQGYTRIEMVSSQTPAKDLDPTVPEGRARVQRMIDDLAAVFLHSVATARGVSLDTVHAQYGGGDVRVGHAAVTAGLVDRLSSYEAVHAALAARAAVPVGATRIAPPPPAALVAPRLIPSGDTPMALRKKSRSTAAARRRRVRAAYAAGDTITIGVTRDVGVTDGDIGVIDEVVEGRFYAVAVGDSDDVYAWLAESEIAAAAGDAPADEGVEDDVDASEPADEDDDATATDDEDDDDAAASEDDDDDDDKQPMGTRRSAHRSSRVARQVVATLRRKAASAERARILGILAYDGRASAATIRACIEDAKCTPARAAQRILAAGSNGGTQRLRALRSDEQSLAASGLTHGAPSASASKQGTLTALVAAGYNRKRHGGRSA